MQTTSIAWVKNPDGSPGKTWNPVRGCSRVSEGCRHCYAEKIAARFSGPGQAFEGFATRSPARWTGRVKLLVEKLQEPFRLREPSRIFVNSTSDLFHETLSDEEIDRVFDVMARSPRHTFQILTKRPKRMRRYSDAQRGQWATGWPLPNVWLGVSVEDQGTAEVRVPTLLATPAAVRFVSYEPAIGPVDFTHIKFDNAAGYQEDWDALDPHGESLNPADDATIDWVIVGGESGPKARPFDLTWAFDTVRVCRSAAIPVFVKQLGARPVLANGHAVRYRDRAGADPSEWPPDLRVQEFPKGAQ